MIARDMVGSKNEELEVYGSPIFSLDRPLGQKELGWFLDHLTVRK